MQFRTFFRIMFNNIIRDNVIARTISAFVNFCCELDILNDKCLKYKKELPLSLEDTKKIETVSEIEEKSLCDRYFLI